MPAALPVEPKRRAVGKKRQGWKQIHPYVPEEIYAALNLEIAKAKAAGDAEIDQSAVILPLLVQWLSERGVEINLDLE
ncbi:hypothetical protein ACQ4M4_14290 [Leptolyngbya sp. AN02str]|uniref:hypothetical protein n=1 Tax=Leptolyngbya sp. AN02str TaxID=3423363 RepID=UPI003D30F796